MEKKTQCFFKDGNRFVFRKLELYHSSMLEGNEETGKAFRHTYAGQYFFPGYKNISSDAVTLGYERDIFLDPHDKIPITTDTTGKPKKTEKGDEVKAWIAKVAETMRHVYYSKPERKTTTDYVNYALIGVICFMVIGWIIRYATGG